MKWMPTFKYIFPTMLLILSTSTFAHGNYKCEEPCKDIFVVPCPKTHFLMDGIYIGGQVGYDSYWVRQNVSLPAPVTISGNPKINAPGWVGGAFAGVGYYFPSAVYIGIEGFGNYSQANESYSISNAIGTYSSKFSVRWSAGISALPGFGITDSTLVYVRLGYNWVSTKTDETIAGLTATKNNTVSGFNYGVGLETLIVDNWSVRGEYTHTNYSSFSSSFGTNFDPSDNQFMAGIVFHFC